MPLSANTLFHFTKDKETLLSILKTHFYPRLSLEHSDLFKDHALAIPMCCFCDIPLSQISDHVSKYGSYAIGIQKKWAIEKGVTPVMYVHSKSQAYGNLGKHISALRNLYEKGTISKKYANEQFSFILYNSFFLKPYQGTAEIAGKNRVIRFYDEREWRYVAPCLNKEKSKTYLSKEDYLDLTKRKEKDKENEKYGIDFTPSVINYIIVKSEEEILDVKRELLSIKGNKYSYDAVDLLTTRLISVERIKEDF